ARADVVAYSAGVGGSVLPSGYRTVDVSGTLEISRFDPALGTLNSISFDFWVAGSLYWEIYSRDHWGIGFTDYNVLTQVSFLGVVESHREFPVFGGGGAPCGVPAYPTPCTPG